MMHSSNRTISIIGSRGIPAKYGGFETCVETIAPSLVKKGWRVWVSCEISNTKIYKDVSLFSFFLKPFYRIIYETLYDIYSLIFSSLVADIVYILGYGAGFFVFIPKLFGKKVVLNTDGMEWMREKYNCLEKKILLLSEKSAVLSSDVLIADSKVIQQYFKNTYGIKPIYITNGATVFPYESWCQEEIDKLTQNKNVRITKGNYWLVVARLEPENNIHTIVDAYLKSTASRPLIIVGNFNSIKYEKLIKTKIYDIKHKKIIFTGGIYNLKILNMLRWNCYAYIHGHSVGGTNPSLLEIMLMEKIILAYNSIFNKEVGKDSLLYFRNSAELSELIDKVELNKSLFLNLIDKMKYIINKEYSWTDIISQYDELFNKLLE